MLCYILADPTKSRTTATYLTKRNKTTTSFVKHSSRLSEVVASLLARQSVAESFTITLRENEDI